MNVPRLNRDDLLSGAFSARLLAVMAAAAACAACSSADVAQTPDETVDLSPLGGDTRVSSPAPRDSPNHSFGLALDLDITGNQRGTVGEMNRDVVQIFESWGFTSSGHWRYTDPMHFEANRIVNPR